MKRFKEFLKSEAFKIKVKPEIKRFLAVVVFTFIYALGVQWFLEAPDIKVFTGGVPGISQVLVQIFFSGEGQAEAGRVFSAAFIVAVNIPILLLGWFGVSKKFTLYSLLSVLIQSTVIGFIPEVSLGLEGTDHTLLAAILGGLLIGFGIGGALKYGASTGGFDIIAQYWSLKKGQSVGIVSMALNIAIALAGALVSKNAAISAGVVFSYTVIRILLSSVATDRIHTAYNFIEVQIITDHHETVVYAILHKLGRGVTLTKVEGAFSSHEKTSIMCVISTYELQQMIEIIKASDEKAFVITKPVKGIVGNFRKKRIA